MEFQMIKTQKKFCENVKIENFTEEELDPFIIESQIYCNFGTSITNDTKVENKTYSLMEEKSAIDLIKPCSVSIQRLSVYYGESKNKKLFRKSNKKIKSVVNSKKATLFFLEKSNIKRHTKWQITERKLRK